MINPSLTTPSTPSNPGRIAVNNIGVVGLYASRVAKRCQFLADPADRELLRFLAQRSWEAGGLAGVAEAVSASCPEGLGTRTMHKLGCAPGRLYDADEVREVKAEWPRDDESERELNRYKARMALMEALDDDDLEADQAQERATVNARPTHIPAEKFLKYCREVAEKRFADDLKAFCLGTNAGGDSFAPWYFPGALAALRQYQAQWIAAGQADVAVTEVVRRVYEAMDRARAEGGLSLLVGLASVGTGFAVQAKCAHHPGSLLYVPVPATTDDTTFLRAIARSMGETDSLNEKAHSLRVRIETGLQSGEITLVLSAAHNLWPDFTSRGVSTTRIAWVMSLVKRGIPVVMATTPIFWHRLKEVNRRMDYACEEFREKVGPNITVLPVALSKADLGNVARALVPEGDELAIRMLVNIGMGGECHAEAQYVSAMADAVKRARYNATKEGRPLVKASDIGRARTGSIGASEMVLAKALAEPAKGPRKPSVAPRLTPITPLRDSEPSAPATAQNPAPGRLAAAPIRLELIDGAWKPASNRQAAPGVSTAPPVELVKSNRKGTLTGLEAPVKPPLGMGLNGPFAPQFCGVVPASAAVPQRLLAPGLSRAPGDEEFSGGLRVNEPRLAREFATA